MRDPTPELNPVLEHATFELDEFYVDVDVEVYIDGQWNEFWVTSIYDEEGTPIHMTRKEFREKYYTALTELLDVRFG